MAFIKLVSGKFKKVKARSDGMYELENGELVETARGNFVYSMDELRKGVRMIRDENGLFTVLDADDSRIVDGELLNDDGTVEEILYFDQHVVSDLFDDNQVINKRGDAWF